MIYNLNLRLFTKEGLLYPVGNKVEQADHLFVTAKSPKGQTEFWCSDPEASKDIYNVLIKRMADFIKDHESEIHEDFKFGMEESAKEKVKQQCNCLVSDDSSDSGPVLYNPVSNPSHYTSGRKYEPRKVIEDWDLSFYLGNVVKYISRAGRKDNAVEDLEKAQQYLDWEIVRLKAREQE